MEHEISLSVFFRSNPALLVVSGVQKASTTYAMPSSQLPFVDTLSVKNCVFQEASAVGI